MRPLPPDPDPRYDRLRKKAREKKKIMARLRMGGGPAGHALRQQVLGKHLGRAAILETSATADDARRHHAASAAGAARLWELTPSLTCDIAVRLRLESM